MVLEVRLWDDLADNQRKESTRLLHRATHFDVVTPIPVRMVLLHDEGPVAAICITRSDFMKTSAHVHALGARLVKKAVRECLHEFSRSPAEELLLHAVRHFRLDQLYFDMSKQGAAFARRISEKYELPWVSHGCVLDVSKLRFVAPVVPLYINPRK